MGQSEYAGSQSGTTAEYAAALIARLGDRDPLQYLAELPKAVDDLTSGVDPDVLTTLEAPDKWSVKDVVVHLVDSETIYGYRLRYVVAQPGNALPGYDQERWLRALDYKASDWGLALETLRAHRRWNLDWMTRLTAEEKTRWGDHSERGRETVGHLIRLLAAHDMVHRQQIQRILDKVLGDRAAEG
ncbi:MAG: DinB family protein [Longimicrobiales bacterium]